MMKKISILIIIIAVALSACTSDVNPETKESTIDKTEGDVQSEIPEEYRLKQNISHNWNEPLPDSENSGNMDFFNTMGSISTTDDSSVEKLDLPKIKDLFTIEELETFFNRPVETAENYASVAYDDYVEYYLPASGEKLNRNGYVNIGIKAYPNLIALQAVMDPKIYDGKMIDDFGNKAFMYGSTVVIELDNSVVLTVSVHGNGDWEEISLNFAKMVYNKLHEHTN